MDRKVEHAGASGKFVYADISLNGITLDIATKKKLDALPTIRRVLEGLTLHRHDGRKVSVEVLLDDFAIGTPIFKQAFAAPTGNDRYKISIGVGLLIQLSVVARSIAADKGKLRGRTKTRLLNPGVRNAGRETALADFVFHFMLCFILWHEVAHIALGHIDWLKQNSGLSIINEFGYEPMPDNLFTKLQTLEADADRQAALWCTSTIDYAIKTNPFLRYTSRADLFYDIGYIYGTLFGFLDAIDYRPDINMRKHPKANTRLGVALAFVKDYLTHTDASTSASLQTQVIAGGLNALSRSFHKQKEAFDPLEIFFFMSENGNRISEMGVRTFQHKVSSSTDGSFILID